MIKLGELAILEAVVKGIPIQIIPMGISGEVNYTNNCFAKHRYKRGVKQTKKQVTLVKVSQDH
jgi:hypothetical protein